MCMKLSPSMHTLKQKKFQMDREAGHCVATTHASTRTRTALSMAGALAKWKSLIPRESESGAAVKFREVPNCNALSLSLSVDMTF